MKLQELLNKLNDAQEHVFEVELELEKFVEEVRADRPKPEPASEHYFYFISGDFLIAYDGDVLKVPVDTVRKLMKKFYILGQKPSLSLNPDNLTLFDELSIKVFRLRNNLPVPV